MALSLAFAASNASCEHDVSGIDAVRHDFQVDLRATVLLVADRQGIGTTIRLDGIELEIAKSIARLRSERMLTITKLDLGVGDTFLDAVNHSHDAAADEAF